MEYVVIAFRSRSDTVKFAEFLRDYNISVEIVGTPKEAGVGCGLSVKTGKFFLPSVKKAISIFGYKSFAGVFLVSVSAGKRQIRII